MRWRLARCAGHVLFLLQMQDNVTRTAEEPLRKHDLSTPRGRASQREHSSKPALLPIPTYGMGLVLLAALVQILL